MPEAEELEVSITSESVDDAQVSMGAAGTRITLERMPPPSLQASTHSGSRLLSGNDPELVVDLDHGMVMRVGARERRHHCGQIGENV